MAEFTSLTEASKLSEWLERLNALSNKIDELTTTDTENKNELKQLLVDYNSELSTVQSNLYSSVVSNISRIDTTVSNQTETISNISTELDTKLSEAINSLENTVTSELTTIKSSEASYKKEIKDEVETKINELFTGSNEKKVPYTYVTDVPVLTSSGVSTTSDNTGEYGILSYSDYTNLLNIITTLDGLLQYYNNKKSDNTSSITNILNSNTLANAVIDTNSFEIKRVGENVNGTNVYTNTLCIKDTSPEIMSTVVNTAKNAYTANNAVSTSKLDHNIQIKLVGEAKGETALLNLETNSSSTEDSSTIISIPTSVNVFTESNLKNTSSSNGYVVFNNGFKMEWGTLTGKSGMRLPFSTAFNSVPTCTISLTGSDVNSELTISYVASEEELTIYCSNALKTISVSFTAFGVA